MISLNYFSAPEKVRFAIFLIKYSVSIHNKINNHTRIYFLNALDYFQKIVKTVLNVKFHLNPIKISNHLEKFFFFCLSLR